MTTETPPDWVLLEAAKRTNTNLSVDRLRASYHRLNSFTALCDMIAKHEKPPLNRKLACAYEARDSAWAGATTVAIAIRAIELYEEGFGK